MGDCFLSHTITFTSNQMPHQTIANILSVLPTEWHGTTFKNHNLLGREGFEKNLASLLSTKEIDITTEDLENLGNAEDYLRVATNVATTLEVFLARARNFSVQQVFTFSSTVMPIVAVVLTVKKPVHLYIGDEEAPFTSETGKFLELLGGTLTIHKGNPEEKADDVVLAFESAANNDVKVDGVIGTNILYIHNLNKINPAEILVIRKRMSTPMTTPMAISKLQELAGVTVTQPPTIDSAAADEVYAHLQTLSGTDPNPDAKPVVCTAGLTTIASIWITLLKLGGADILMASTAYGGSSQLTDILTERSSLLNKHTFDIQGVQTNIMERIEGRLNDLAATADKLMPTTVLFVEMPTNPDMKVLDVEALVPIAEEYKKKSGKNLVLMVDTTFAPGSQVMKKLKSLAPDLSVLAFISLSKSVSRGITTAGTVVANHTDYATSLIRHIAETATILDATAKPDQIQRLIENHKNVEERCQKAYEAAAACGEALRKSVKEHCDYDMPLAFPTPEQAAVGFTSSTFSFNLPAPKNGSDEINAALAQRFVDLLCAHSEFKPCVSFGQDNGLVYATVPATSTQGAIKEEDKAKQAVGGVQLVRLSFAPTVNVDAVSKILQDSVRTVYAQ